MARPSASLSLPGALPLNPLLLTWSLLLPLLLLLTSSLGATSARAMGPKRKVPALYIFGDSDVDSGNLAILGLSGCAKPPYGQDYIPVSGRCSNGRLSVDFLGESGAPVAASTSHKSQVTSTCATESTVRRHRSQVTSTCDGYPVACGAIACGP